MVGAGVLRDILKSHIQSPYNNLCLIFINVWANLADDKLMIFTYFSILPHCGWC